MLFPALWFLSIGLMVLGGVTDAAAKRRNFAYEGDMYAKNAKTLSTWLLAVGTLLFIVMTLCGLWQAWAPWDINIVVR